VNSCLLPVIGVDAAKCHTDQLRKVDFNLARLTVIAHHTLYLQLCVQGVSGALEVLMKDAIRPNIMQTLEV